MRVCIIGGDSDLQNQCRAVLEEGASGDWDLIRSADPGELPEAELYIWDFQPGSISRRLKPEIVTRSLFLVDVKMVEQLRELLGTTRASIVLKPAPLAALQPFLEHAFRHERAAALSSPESEEASAHRDAEDLLECLLHANLKLQEYDQSRTNFLARAAHDFRAPLTALNGYCGLLTEQRLGPLSSNQLDLLARMQHSVKRLSRLAEAMFELSVDRHSKREMVIQPNDLEASISQAIHEITPHALEKQIRVNASVESPDHPLMFDAGRIEQVLINLLENACKFTPKHGTIDIVGCPVFWRNQSQPLRSQSDPAAASNGERHEAPRVANAYRIDVRDSGCGIPAEHIETIFEEYTSYSGGKDRSGGGLGLAICRMIVDSHQGGIWAESDGTGTQFSFVLPYRNSTGGLWVGGKPVTAAVGMKTLSA